MKNKHFSSKLDLAFNIIALLVVLCCAILSEEPIVKALWIVCAAVWGIRIIMDIRAIIKKASAQKDGL